LQQKGRRKEEIATEEKIVGMATEEKEKRYIETEEKRKRM
jgi:hypothetical protein